MRGVLPRSFKDSSLTDPLKSDSMLFDAALAILAVTSKDNSLAEEISTGIHEAEQIASGKLPLRTNHITPDDRGSYSISTNAVAAYSLSYYLHYYEGSNKANVAETCQNILEWLLAKRNSNSFIVADDTYTYTLDNIYTWFALKQAGQTINTTFSTAATSLKAAIDSMLVGSRFPVSNNDSSNNLETDIASTFYLIETGESAKASTVLFAIETDYAYSYGYRPSGSGAVWVEATYAIACLYKRLGNTTKYNSILSALNALQNEDGSWSYGIIKDGNYQVLSYESVGATAWSYIANTFPNRIFKIQTQDDPINISPRFYNSLYQGGVQKDDCGVGTGTTVNYVVLPATYSSTVDQNTADGFAISDFNANAQAYANANGSCYQWSNDARTGYFKPSGCAQNTVGSYSYTINATNEYFSSISQEHANALADAALITEGQAYADAQACGLNVQVVFITPNVTVTSGANDDVYLNFTSNYNLLTHVYVAWEYSEDGNNWTAGSTIIIPKGATSSFTYAVTSTPSGAGSTVEVRITGVGPDDYTFGGLYKQVYDFESNTLTTYGNEEQTAYFIKEGCSNIDVSSVVAYTVAASYYQSTESQEHANALAWQAIISNGQTYANANGSCA